MSRPVSAFQKLDKLGEGTYGSVYKARDRTSGALVALKRIKISSDAFDREGMPLTSLREVNLLRRLRHPNVVSLLDVVVGTKLDSLFLVFEFCEHDLARLLDAMPTAFSPAEIKCLSQQLLYAVAHLHANAVLHRDLKLSNLLLASDGTLKLCDFGLARAIEPPEGKYTGRVVTLWYRAPELLLGATTYGFAVDMWAVGCILGELILHRPLMPAPNELKQLEMMCDLLGTPNERIWPEYSSLPLASSIQLRSQPYNELPSVFAGKRPTAETLALLNALLTYDPRKRISARAALDHEYFKQRPPPQRKSLLTAARLPGEFSRQGTLKRTNPHVTHGGAGAGVTAEPHRTACMQSLAEEGGEGVVQAACGPRARKPSCSGCTSSENGVT
eukprot:CAMPEP_0183367266 /NCGR_PEP_ID=MMETSP0164_2-20130417/91873_1 /TAXON_ID=221442 /ORGANISM="Coccolithus pelagicus ssp braarudi, Strain PLY182g" /LENGTH=386 /DNA_ID=CAMNT_0025543173 /DNA_START=12 /DNA_END=1172 /DNA_ORIENTATION=+